MSELNGKVALVTGAGRGLARALALAFAAQGAVVAANDLVPTNLDETIEQIEASAGRACAYLADVSKKLDLQTMIASILADWERIDILVNSASVQARDALLDIDEWDLRRSIDVNLTGAFLAMQSVGRVMRQLGGGVIVNLGPVDAEGSSRTARAAYLAARGGLVTMTASAAEELAVHKIRVNAVSPSMQSHEKAVAKILSLCRPECEITGQSFIVP